MSNFSLEELRSLIRENLETNFPNLLQEKQGSIKGLKGKTKETKIYIPQFRISEQWGTPGSDDRQLIESFTKRIKGNSLGQKIQSMNSFVSECDAACAQAKTVDEILANLVFLDSLASVIYDFNPMTGGFLFESLIAALFGGSAKQVPTKGGIDQDVTDIVDDKGRPMSLKFFFEGASQYVKGSYDNLRSSIVNNGEPMWYLIGLKERDHVDKKVLSIGFYEFSVGSKKDGIPGQFDVSQIGSYYGLSIGAVIGAKKRGRRRKGETGPRERAPSAFHIGTLNFGSREDIQKIAQNYADSLGSTLIGLYEQVELLSNNINQYFLNPPDEKDKAIEAQRNTRKIGKYLREL